MLRSSAFLLPKWSICTEWSTTRSTGTSGSITLGSSHLVGNAAHRREIAEKGHAGEVLQHDAGDDERDFFRALGRRLPVGQLAHVLFGHFLAVAVAQHRLEHDANGDGKPRNVHVEGFAQGRK